MNNQETEKKPGNRRELLFLVVVFVGPFLAAWVVYNYTSLGNNGPTSNYGELITPPLPVEDLKLARFESGGDAGTLYGKWSIIYLPGVACPETCQDHIRLLRNLRPALAGNSARLQTILAVDKSQVTELRPIMPADFNWNGVLTMSPLGLRKALESGSREQPPPPVEAGFYLVDPLGNIMMRYKPDSDGAGILGDLKRLLRYSRIG